MATPQNLCRWVRSQSVAAVVGLALSQGTAAQMTTPGSFGVGPSGSATYTVPLRVPPGVAGLQPSLSLVHSSQGGGSQLGGGFTLMGLSAITRCPPTPAQDGWRRRLSFDTGDRYCLDGQRLILVSGTEGANGAEYRTEFETFSKVTAYNPSGSGVTGGPAYFVVKTKSGQTLEYGQTTNPGGSLSGARVFAKKIDGGTDTAVLTWALNKVSDTVGNYMAYTYTNDVATGQYYISKIDYTGNANKTLTPATTSRITFTYESTLGVRRWQSGRQVISGVQLKSISASSYMPGISSQYGSIPPGYYPVVDYSLAQSGDDNVSPQASVTECGYSDYSSNPICKPPVTVSSTAAGRGFSAQTMATGLGWGSADSMWVGDFNGDGISDLASASGATVRMRLGQAGGVFSEVSWAVSNAFTWGNSGFTWVGDFNGDGRADLATTSAGVTYVLLSNGAGFVAQSWGTGMVWGSQGLSFVGDFDGDARADLATIIGSNVTVYRSTGSAFSASTASLNAGAFPSGVCSAAYGLVGDFDSDGRSDLALTMDACGDSRIVTLYSANAGSVFSYYAWRSTPIYMDGWRFVPQFVGDFNGDGLADLLGFYVSAWSPGAPWYLTQPNFVVLLSTGEWFSDPIQTDTIQTPNGLPEEIASATAWSGDFNGDGLTDIASMNTSGAIIWGMSTGTGFNFGQWPISNWGDVAMTRAGDFNGDGRTDIASPSGTSLHMKWTPAAANSLVQTFSNGLGSDVTVTHALLRTGVGAGTYTPMTQTYPIMALSPAMPLVAKVTSQDGMGGIRDTTYQYKGYAAQAASGRGAPAFASMTVTDNFGFVNETTYSLSFPYLGYPLTVTQKKNGAVVTQTTNTPACVHPDPAQAPGQQTTCSPGPGKRYFVYTSQSVTNGVRDITSSGAVGVALPGTSTLSDMVDGYGNIGRITTTTLNPDGTDSVYKKVVTNDYYNDSTRWFLGRLRKTTVATTGPDVPSSVTPGSGGLATASAPPLPPQILTPILSLLLDD